MTNAPDRHMSDRRETLQDVSDQLPPDIADEVAAWPEFRMGVHRVRVKLNDGRTFDNVMVAGGRVAGVLGRDEVPFEASQVVAVTDFADAPLPPGY
jgi:hypothetical protein